MKQIKRPNYIEYPGREHPNAFTKWFDKWFDENLKGKYVGC